MSKEMARIRTIKPEFQQSQSIGSVSREARLTFILLWPQCDDHGRVRANSRMLASVLFPYDNDAPEKMEVWLTELETAGCIRLYSIDGKEYLDIPKWHQHQRVDHPQQSKYPPFREDSRMLANNRERSGVDQGPRTKEGTKDQGKESKQIVEVLKYAFSGKVIKLSQEDFDTWKKRFTAFNGSFDGYLESRDAYLASRSEEEQKKWFISTAAWLAKVNASILEKNPPRKKNPHVGSEEWKRQRREAGLDD